MSTPDTQSAAPANGVGCGALLGVSVATMPSAPSNTPQGVLLTGEHALLVDVALSDAEEIGLEAIARHMAELGESTPKNKATAEWLRACVAGFGRARQAIKEAAPPNTKDRDVIDANAALSARAPAMATELGSPTDEPNAANGSAYARLNWWKLRCDELHEQIAALAPNVKDEPRP